MQLRKHSFIEAMVNVGAGFGIALLAQIIIFPVFDIHIDTEAHLLISGFFTIVSIIRTYTLRRLFNWYTVKGMKKKKEGQGYGA